jgi:hypothetical protein
MAKPAKPPAPTQRAHYLDLSDERRAAAEARVAALSDGVRAAAREVPLTADVDDFRRVLVANAPKAKKS